MPNRSPITVETVMAIAKENAGHPLEPERAATCGEALEPILGMIDAIRSLPLKDIEPAPVFRPIEVTRDDG